MPKGPIAECPRCDEGDERSIGRNRCGLCECEFFVARDGKVTVAQFPVSGPALSEAAISRMCGGALKK